MTELARRPGPVARLRVTESGVCDARVREDVVVAEEPLEIRLGSPGSPAARAWVTMRTPGHDFELATGWAVHEGLVEPGDVESVVYCTDVEPAAEQELNVVTLTSARPVGVTHRHGALSGGSSACGVCGKDSIGAVLTTVRRTSWTGPEPSPARRTGGRRAPQRGRQGHRRASAGGWTAEACLVVSGRAGFELVQKAVAAGVGSLVAVGAPTSLAVHLAAEAGLGLFGFTSAERTVGYV